MNNTQETLPPSLAFEPLSAEYVYSNNIGESFIKKIKFDESMLGKHVNVVCTRNKGDFVSGNKYAGKILEERDWLTGYPIFENDNGFIGIGRDCEICSVINLSE